MEAPDIVLLVFTILGICVIGVPYFLTYVAIVFRELLAVIEIVADVIKHYLITIWAVSSAFYITKLYRMFKKKKRPEKRHLPAVVTPEFLDHWYKETQPDETNKWTWSGEMNVKSSSNSRNFTPPRLPRENCPFEPMMRSPVFTSRQPSEVSDMIYPDVEMKLETGFGTRGGSGDGDTNCEYYYCACGRKIDETLVLKKIDGKKSQEESRKPVGMVQYFN